MKMLTKLTLAALMSVAVVPNSFAGEKGRIPSNPYHKKDVRPHAAKRMVRAMSHRLSKKRPQGREEEEGEHRYLERTDAQEDLRNTKRTGRRSLAAGLVGEEIDTRLESHE